MMITNVYTRFKILFRNTYNLRTVEIGMIPFSTVIRAMVIQSLLFRILSLFSSEVDSVGKFSTTRDGTMDNSTCWIADFLIELVIRFAISSSVRADKNVSYLPWQIVLINSLDLLGIKSQICFEKTSQKQRSHIVARRL